MINKRLMLGIRQAVLENAGNELVSLYLIGSFLSEEMVESSDIDLVGVMKPSFDFRRESRINKTLNETVRSGHRIDLGTMSYDEFFGGPRKGSLTKHIDLPIFLNFLKGARLICGKRINFDKLPVKPASAEEELRYWIRVYDEHKSDFIMKDRIRPDFSFRDFIKIIFYIANLELQLLRNQSSKSGYVEIERAFANDKTHLVHYSMRMRRNATIGARDRRTWLHLADRYVAWMNISAAKLQFGCITLKNQVLTQPAEVERGWHGQYRRLATEFARRLGKNPLKIAEVGCGGGRLTIPLMKLLGNSEFVLVDKFADTTTWVRLEILVANLRKAKLMRRAQVVISDYLTWIRSQRDRAYDAIISCEFLPEITAVGMKLFIRESNRVLKRGGAMVHCFWSPSPRNSRQRLVIEADSDPKWTRTPPEEWFSPKPTLVASELTKAGFKHVRTATFMSHLVLRGEAAKSELKRWEVRPSFYEKYRRTLDEQGLEFPDWIIVSAKKSS
jgi:cyclopropane fatty-acyl-phospholipid synthase-like methyltransferase/predicted nucleotidyltransferase